MNPTNTVVATHLMQKMPLPMELGWNDLRPISPVLAVFRRPPLSASFSKLRG